MIAKAELLLGCSLPASLKELYFHYDGFREPLGNAQYLYPLLESDDGGSSLVQMTLFYRKEHSPPPDFSNTVFFGSSGGDECWGMGLTIDSPIIAYHHHMEDEYKIAGKNLIEVYLADQKSYGIDEV